MLDIILFHQHENRRLTWTPADQAGHALFILCPDATDRRATGEMDGKTSSESTLQPSEKREVDACGPSPHHTGH